MVEVQRRESEEAKQVAAVMDGADWLQGVSQYHRADAVHILDFPHAAEYISAIGERIGPRIIIPMSEKMRMKSVR